MPHLLRSVYLCPRLSTRQESNAGCGFTRTGGQLGTALGAAQVPIAGRAQEESRQAGANAPA
jgi:hypothetical protein